MIYGLDYLLAANYSKETIANCVKTFPSGWAVGVFSTLPEGGDARPFIKEILFIKDPLGVKKCVRVRVQLMWKDGHGFSKSDFPTIAAEAKKWIPLIKANPNVDWQFSGACEHNLNTADATLLRAQVRAALAGIKFTYINSPLIGAPTNNGALIAPDSTSMNELHGKIGTTVNKYNFSFDGTNAVDADIQPLKDKAIKSKCQTFFLWVPQFNMNRNMKKEDTLPRPERKVTLTTELIESVIYEAGDKGKMSLAAKYTYKSHCEQTIQDTAKDVRANKPVIIVPQNIPNLSLVTASGKVVATAKNAGKYTGAGGGYRYYCSTFGYQVAEKARGLQGSPIVKLMAGKKLIGTINPAFRAGKFR